MAISAPVFSQTVSGSVVITCTGSKNTYVLFSIMKNRIGTVKGAGGDTGYRGDTVAPYPAYSPSASIVTTSGARPEIGANNRVRVGDSITTLTVPVGMGIHVMGFGPNGAQTHSSDATTGTLNLAQWYVAW